MISAYFLNPEMIRFLLIENLALKTLLHEKGIVDPQEFKTSQQKSESILDQKVRAQLQNWIKEVVG